MFRNDMVGTLCWLTPADEARKASALCLDINYNKSGKRDGWKVYVHTFGGQNRSVTRYNKLSDALQHYAHSLAIRGL